MNYPLIKNKIYNTLRPVEKPTTTNPGTVNKPVEKTEATSKPSVPSEPANEDKEGDKGNELTDIPIDEKHFPDDAFRTILRSDYGEKLSDNEIKETDQLRLSSEEIKDLKGIEYFTNLKVLWCSFNDLTSLNVSNNLELTELYCDYNKLSTINLSKNTKLKILHCFDNEIVELDLRQNTELNKLKCSGNKLTALDLSKNKNLTELNCSSNQLASLDLSNNIGLLDDDQTSDIEVYIKDGKVNLLDLDKNIKKTG